VRSPFRDEREAALSRVAELERENADLREELAASRRVRTVPSPASRAPQSHWFIAVAALALLTGASLAAMARRSPRLAEPPAAAMVTPSMGDVRWNLVSERTHPIRAGAAVGRTVYFADDEGGIVRFGDPGAEGDDLVPRGTSILGIGGGPTAVYAVGAHGTILAENGRRGWDVQRAPADVDLFGVVALGVSGWAVGREGAIFLRHDAGWTRERTPTTHDLFGVARTPDATYAVGAEGTILVRRDDRGEWIEEPSGVSADLHAVFFQDGALYTVGDHGTVLRRARDGWVREASGTRQDLRAIGSDGARIFAVGDLGTVLSSSGAGVWRREDTPTGQLLVAVGATSGGVYVASSTGTLLRRSP
jgi:hypothetical protein